MKALLLASVAMLALSNVAHAADVYYSETCGSSVLNVGTYSRDRDVSVHAVYDHGYWRVLHTLSNGHVYDRGVQYSIDDATVADDRNMFYPQWDGTLNRNPAIKMVGKLFMQGNVANYSETMTKNGQIIMASDAVCEFDGASPAPAPTYASAPTYAPALDRLPVSISGNQAHAAVSVGTLPIIMLVDTGCTNMSVIQNIADQLLASGQARRGEDVQSTIADGSTHTEASIVINSVTIGGHVLSNVPAAVAPNGAEMLLGFNVLNRVSGKFAINVANSTLDFD
jgi:clan AA aspartic protease (TIGR02281 family)